MTSLFCRKCGAGNTAGQSTCTNCGRPLAEASTTPLPQVRCAACGALNVQGRAICQKCEKELRDAERLTTAAPEAAAFKARNQNVGMVVFLIVSVVTAVLGFLSLSNATAGVGGIALAILFAVYARIAQAGALHDRTERHLEHVAKQQP